MRLTQRWPRPPRLSVNEVVCHGVPSEQVRDPITWTILQKDGPCHLGLRCNELPAHQMALITSGLCALQAHRTARSLRRSFCFRMGTDRHRMGLGSALVSSNCPAQFSAVLAPSAVSNSSRRAEGCKATLRVLQSLSVYVESKELCLVQQVSSSLLQSVSSF